ncbi:MAG: response regulator [Erysipelotrichales bacterium]|nr:response regulator [Erysipelotrichales bacterium]
MKIALIEDNVEYSDLLYQRLVNQNINIHLEIFNDGESFLMKETNFDLIILDIELPGIDGIKLSKSITNKKTKIVFLTSTSDRVYEAFGEKVLGYLLKSNDIQININQLIKFINQIQVRTSIQIKTELGETEIELNDILKVSKENRKLYITTCKNKIQVYQSSLSNIYDKTSDYLIYINKSTLVNAMRIVSFTDKSILLECNIQDTISRDYLHGFKREYLKKVSL